MSSLRTRTATLLLLITLASCENPDTIPPYFFLFASPPAMGLERPTAPGNARGSYNQIFQEILLEWNPSSVPGNNFPFLVYRIYFYPYSPPSECCLKRDLLEETIGTNFIFTEVPFFTGNLYFHVTAFDGLAESLPGNLVTINALNR